MTFQSILGPLGTSVTSLLLVFYKHLALVRKSSEDVNMATLLYRKKNTLGPGMVVHTSQLLGGIDLTKKM
jgi:hypothetical protein